MCTTGVSGGGIGSDSHFEASTKQEGNSALMNKVYIYICMYIYVFIYIHIYINMFYHTQCIYICMNTHTCICKVSDCHNPEYDEWLRTRAVHRFDRLQVHMYIYICIHICIRMHVYMFMYIYIHAYIHMYIYLCIYMYMYRNKG
jgi:hypothetical protein